MTTDEMLKEMYLGMTEIKTQVNKIENKIDNLEVKFDKLEDKVDNLEVKFDKLENRVSKIEVTLENDIRGDIQLLVEGHTGLFQNMEKTAKMTSISELQEYRIKLLERETKLIKRELNMN